MTTIVARRIMRFAAVFLAIVGALSFAACASTPEPVAAALEFAAATISVTLSPILWSEQRKAA